MSVTGCGFKDGTKDGATRENIFGLIISGNPHQIYIVQRPSPVIYALN
jgi:hypothetical protein